MGADALFMESTEIAPERTAIDIRKELLKARASKIMDEYDPAGKLIAMTFSIDTPAGDLPFRLPVRVEPVFKLLKERRKPQWKASEYAKTDRIKAERIAWRQAYRWVQAQVAMVQTGMVSTQEVFMPYLVFNGKTLYETLDTAGMQKLLGAGVPV